MVALRRNRLTASTPQQSEHFEREAPVSNRHQYFADPAVGRLMGTIMALTGELFVAKAEIEVLRRALIAQGIITDQTLDHVNESAEMQVHLVEERDKYAQHIFDPIRQPDLSLEQHWALFGAEHDPDVPSDPRVSAG